MSGHNPPHGRLGQPNSTWNPLQVPSYIPRQPQLAHMSSERSMARSPLTWHTPPNHQDQLYNFMSANHKNNLEINPILPTFGRNSGMPLGSVDLSLSSAARSTPSPKGSGNNLQQLPGPPPLGPLSQQQQPGPQLPSNIPPGMGSGGGPPPSMPDQNDHFHHKMGPGQQQQQPPHGQHQQHHHMNANHNRSGPSSQIGSVIQSTAALKDRSSHGPLGPHGSSSSGVGNNGGAAPSCSFLGPGPGGLPPQAAAGGNGYYNMMSTNSNVPPMPAGPNVSTASINNRPPSAAAAAAGPVGGLHNMPPMGPGSDFGGLHIKDAKQLNSEVGKNGRDNMPGGVETSDLVKDILLHAMQSNPVSVSPKRNSSLQTPIPPGHSPTRSRSPPANSSSSDAGHQPAASVAKSFPLISANVPSTPPEVTPDVAAASAAAAAATKTDSPPLLRAPSTSPAAPSAAVPVPSPSQSITSNDDSADSNSSKSRRRRKPDRTSKMSSADELERMHDFLTGENSADKCGGVDRIDGIDPMRPNIAVRNDIATLALEGISGLSQGLASDSSHSPHITDLSDSTRINLQQQTATTTTTTTTPPTLNESNNRHPETRESPRIKSPAAAVSSVISSVLSAAAAMAESRKDSESTSDDCETIDKIAAMISSTEGDEVAQVPVVATSNGPSGAGNAEATTVPAGEGSSSSGSSKPESQHKPDADKSYEEIENKLEEMFAGIEESLPPSKSSPAGAKKASPAAKQLAASEPATDILTELAGKTESESTTTGSSNSPEAEAEPGPSGTQKKVLTPAAKRASVGNKAAGTPPNKRKKVLKKKSAHGKGTSFAAAEERMASFGAGGKAGAGKKPITKGGKKGASASAAGSNGGKNAKVKSNEAGAATADLNGKYKGPFVQVKSDGSHMVINAPINEDDSDKPQNKTKKFTNSMNNSEKSKIRGLHVSTLSTKYDADTTDASWMCVFCKTGPHKMRLGDLFGPYIISTKSGEFAESKTDQDYFSEKRTRESLASKLKVEPAPGVAGGSGAKSKKRKSVEPTASTSAAAAAAVPSAAKVPPPPVDMFYGMVKAGDDSYEVWMHEDCLVWAPGVHIIGTRIVGLEAAIWNCCRHQCRICGHSGAVVSCLRRACNAEAHVTCARKHDWELTDEFKAHCKDHSGDDS
uniref:Putative transcription factor tcf20 n=1 Tax=Culex tarsalis TaxID=7177 RepID=A0A1Q3EWS3_CULTA